MSETRHQDLHAGFAKAWTDYRITDDTLYMQHHEDVTDVMAINKYLKGFTPQELTNKKYGWRWVARLPLSLDMELAKKGIYKSKKEFNRWKNSPENDIWALSKDVKLIGE